MTSERLRHLREAHQRGMEPHWYHALAAELFAEIDALAAQLAKVTGERDDALNTIRALVDHPEPSGTEAAPDLTDADFPLYAPHSDFPEAGA